jgi:hypothetical protein
MLNDNAKKWIVALRSGEYKQVKGVLTRIGLTGQIEGHCCLGVACEVALANNVKIKKTTNPMSSKVFYDNEGSYLPETVKVWLGISHKTGAYLDKSGCPEDLALQNDMGLSFEKIADLIESEPQGLFLAKEESIHAE